MSRTPRTKPSEQLIAKLRKHGFELPDDVKFSRLYPGHWQRSSGAWVWHIVSRSTGYDIGSCDTVRDCLRAHHLSGLPNGEIIAEKKP